MKKAISIFLSLALIICTLSFGTINAFANDKKTATSVALNSSITAYVDTNNKYFVKFEPTVTGYYEFACFTYSVDSSIYASIVDSANEVYNTVVNDYTNPYLICAAKLEAGKTYYYVLESLGTVLSTGVTVRAHNHTYSQTKAFSAYADSNDASLSHDGEVYTVCAYCTDSYTSAVYYAPATVKLSTSSYTYNGKTKKPAVTVYDRLGNVIDKSQYTVSYKSNKNPGYGIVSVNFSGNYSGSLTASITIKPKKETLSSLKSSAKKKLTVKWKKDTTVTGYEVQYSTSSKFTKNTTKTSTIKKNSTTSKTVSSLKSKKKYYVRLRAYKTSNGKKLYGAWSSVKNVKIK